MEKGPGMNPGRTRLARAVLAGTFGKKGALAEHAGPGGHRAILPPSQNVPAPVAPAQHVRPPSGHGWARVAPACPPSTNIPAPPALAPFDGPRRRCWPRHCPRTCWPRPLVPHSTALAQLDCPPPPPRTCRGQLSSPNMPGPLARPPSSNVPGQAALAQFDRPCRTCRPGGPRPI